MNQYNHVINTVLSIESPSIQLDHIPTYVKNCNLINWLLDSMKTIPNMITLWYLHLIFLLLQITYLNNIVYSKFMGLISAWLNSLQAKVILYAFTHYILYHTIFLSIYFLCCICTFHIMDIYLMLYYYYMLHSMHFIEALILYITQCAFFSI